MSLQHVVFLLLYTYAVTILSHSEENSEQIIRRKALNFYGGLTKKPIEPVQEKRDSPILKKVQNKGPSKSAGFKKPFNKKWNILPKLKRRNPVNKFRLPSRRAFNKKRIKEDDARRRFTSDSKKESSTSEEIRDWKKGFDEDWMNLKKEAIAVKLSYNNSGGDKVNMMAARPWTAPCGDPDLHDWAWGSCTLESQCEGEYRIYRGDYFCGRSQLVCCSVLYTSHDLYQGFDMSFEDTASSTSDSKESIDSAGIRKKKKKYAKIWRWRRRRRYKKRIKKRIRKLVSHLRKILNRAFRNTSSYRLRKIKQLRKIIKKMKSKYRYERKILKEQYAGDSHNVDVDLYKKLLLLDSVNTHFLINETFREFLMRYNIRPIDLKALNLRSPGLLSFLAANAKYPHNILKILTIAQTSLGIDNDQKQLNKPMVISKRFGSNVLPSVSLQYDIDPNFEKAEREKKASENMQENVEMVNDTSKLVDTRRSGRRYNFQPRKGQKRKRKDNLEYDIEYGNLYF